MRYFWLLAAAAIILAVIAAHSHATDGTCLQMLDGKCIKVSLVK